jgi:ribonuclease HI
VVADVDGAIISVGMKQGAGAVFWTSQAAQVRSVAARARNIAGDNPDTDAAISALQEAATECRATLTEHSVAVARAANAARKLDAYLDSLRGTGTLREFTKAYRRRRIAAKERGQGYMTFQQAELRFKRAFNSVADVRRPAGDRRVALRRGVRRLGATGCCARIRRSSFG